MQEFSPDADLARVTTIAALPLECALDRFAGSAAEGAAAATGGTALPQPVPLVEAIARIAATRLDAPQPRPAPFYLRGADAAPPSDPPPVILP